MTSATLPSDPRLMRGVLSVTLGYALFSVQDATVKWLVGTYAVPQVLFTRSLVIILIASLIGGRPAYRSLGRSRTKAALFGRAMLILVAWLLYYSAARHLQLAQLTTIYFAAPVVVVVLSTVVLKEQVDAPRWLAVLVGFFGVLLASNPFTNRADVGAAFLALLAAFCWGGSVILARLINRTESTTAQMIVSNALFAICCAPSLLWLWRMPDGFSLALMLGLGIAGGLGQFFLYEGFRDAPASVAAPIEYTGLVWAFVYGYLIWSDIPPPAVFAGALCIVGASLTLILYERRRASRLLRSRLGMKDVEPV